MVQIRSGNYCIQHHSYIHLAFIQMVFSIYYGSFVPLSVLNCEDSLHAESGAVFTLGKMLSLQRIAGTRIIRMAVNVHSFDTMPYFVSIYIIYRNKVGLPPQ